MLSELKASKTDIQLGALYRAAVKFRLTPHAVEALLVSRVRMKPDVARQLAAHWFSTEPLRNSPCPSA